MEMSKTNNPTLIDSHNKITFIKIRHFHDRVCMCPQLQEIKQKAFESKINSRYFTHRWTHAHVRIINIDKIYNYNKEKNKYQNNNRK